MKLETIKIYDDSSSTDVNKKIFGKFCYYVWKNARKLRPKQFVGDHVLPSGVQSNKYSIKLVLRNFFVFACW